MLEDLVSGLKKVPKLLAILQLISGGGVGDVEDGLVGCIFNVLPLDFGEDVGHLPILDVGQGFVLAHWLSISIKYRQSTPTHPFISQY